MHQVGQSKLTERFSARQASECPVVVSGGGGGCVLRKVVRTFHWKLISVEGSALSGNVVSITDSSGER